MTNVTILADVTSIGESAFEYCYGLTSVTLPDSLTSIGSNAFHSCSNLTDVAIPTNVTSIGDHAFNGCSGLTSLSVASGNSVYHSAGNCIIETASKTLIAGCSTSVIPSDSSVTSIGESAFEYCYGLTSVTLPDSLTSIGSDAFHSCSNLTDVTIPKNVTSIGDSVFAWCYNLTSVTIPTSVTSIGRGAFENCHNLTDVYFGGTQEEWNKITFGEENDCLTSAEIHFTASTAVSGTCGENLTWTLDSEGTLTISGEGAMDDYHDPTEITTPWRGYRTSIKSVVLEEGVTYVGEWAFYVGTNLTSVTLPQSLTGIGYNAFHSCSSLTDVTIPENVTSIGGSAFAYCSSLTSVTLPDSVTDIGDLAFSHCSGLTSVTIPKSVTNIGDGAFASCWSLVSLRVAEGNPVYHSHGNCIIETATKTLIKSCANGTIPTDGSVTSIGYGAFAGCRSLGGVTLPNSITSIAENAFLDCSSLMQVTIPKSVTSIGKKAFANCRHLTDVYFYGTQEEWNNIKIGEGNDYLTGATLRPAADDLTWTLDEDGVLTISGTGNMVDYEYHRPGSFRNGYKADAVKVVKIEHGVTSIGDYAFFCCSNLTSVTIPESVTSIGQYAFADCSSLTSVTIPASVTSMDYDLFQGCGSLNSLTVDSGNPVYHSDGNCLIETVSKTLMRGCSTSVIPTDGSVTSVNGYAFSDCAGLTSITIPASVTSIGVDAFLGCTGLTGVVISEGVTRIDSGAFEGCSSLTSIAIPSSVTSIGYGVFEGCSSLISLTVANGNSVYHSVDNCLIDTAPKTLVRGCPSSVIPTDGSVTSISQSAFSDCTGLTALTIPDSVTQIGYRTFYGCTNLTSITIPDGVTSISDSAFRECSSLSSVVIPDSVTSIDRWAFFGCTSLTSIMIPENVTSIGYGAFGFCSSLTSITIPENVISIDRFAFNHCSSLTSLTVADGNPVYHSDGNCIIETASKTLACGCSTSVIPTDGSVTSIGETAFSGCANLTDITIPASVTSIDWYAFADCTSLTSIVIPDGVTIIGDSAFRECSSLSSVVIPASVTSIDGCAFMDCTSLTSITIPDGVTSIGGYAFSDCTSLTSITIPASATILDGEGAFSDCTNLTSITIPYGVTQIGANTFNGCTKLTSITIPSSVTSIRAYAFDNATNLTDVYFNGTQGKWNKITIGEGNDCLTNAEIHFTSSAVTSGTCGENLTWTLDSEGVLTISGTGNTVQSPWSDYRDLIKIVKIEHGVTVIGAGLFSNYTNLTRVTIPNSVFAIAGSAFSGCTSLKSVAIPASVSNIGPAAFDGCSSLTSVGLSTGLSSIVNGVFSGCTSLTDVYFTGTQEEWDSIKIMGGNEPLTNATLHLSTAVGTCGTNLTWTLDSKGTLTISGEGAMYDYHDPTEITTPWRDYRTSIKSVVLEEGVTHVGEWAFYVGINLTSVTLPNSLTSIGGNAFHSCSSLTDVTIPENVTSIGGSAFAYCSSLTGITIPKSTTSLGGMLFGYCDSLTSLTVAEGNPVYHSVGNCIIETETNTLLQGCSASTIPSDGSMTSIGDSAFAGCSGLTSMTIPDGVTSIDKYAFADCSSLTSVTIPDSVTDIGKFAFSDDSSLSSVIIPESVTNIGEGAFNRCSGLTSLSVASGNPVYHSDGNCIIETASKTLLLGCSTSVIPTDGSVTSIGYGAFAGCRNLGGVTLPDSITSIADYAFIACSNLTRVSIPKSVTSIGNRAFTHCSNLTDVYFGGTQEEWNKITIGEENDYLTSADIHFTSSTAFVASGTCGDNLTWSLDSDGVLTISGTGNMADYRYDAVMGDTAADWQYYGNTPWWAYRSTIKVVKIGSDVTRIGYCAFADCNNLTSITIPDSVTGIGSMAFLNCLSLNSVMIPGSVTSIGEDAFMGCENLTSVTISDGVTSIEDYAFELCSSLTSVNIPASVTNIGAKVFQGCTSLTNVYYNGTQEEWDKINIDKENENLTSAKLHLITASGTCGKNLTWTLDSEGTLIISGEGEMDDYVPQGSPWWDYRSAVVTVKIKSGVTSIGNYAFDSCNNMTGVEIPDGVTAIGKSAFGMCSSLIGVTIPESVTSIGLAAFECSGLTTVTIPKGVTEIGMDAFHDCWDLTSATILDGVTSIGVGMFGGCSSLKNVSIPSSVTGIGFRAFENCTSLTDVYFGGTQEVWEQITLGANNEQLSAAQVHCQKCVRISGSNRYATAIAVANELKKTWEVEKFDAIILASGQEFADALAGSYLATVKNAPILLSYGGGGKYAYLDTDNIDYIKNNLVSGGIVYILGGTSAVPNSYDTALESSGLTVMRLAGKNRFETNLAILTEAGVPAGSEVLVCNGSNFADSLSASATGKPILLVWNERGTLYGKQSVFLNSLQECTFTIIGGQSAVSSDFENILDSYGTVTRVAGKNRLDTSVKVAEKYFQKPTSAVLAYAWDFPDGLCGGVLADAMGAPLILTASGLETQAAEYVEKWGLDSGIALGGTKALPDSSILKIYR